MNWKRHFFEAATLIVAAVLCAMVSNALASRERKLVVMSTLSTPRVAVGVLSATGPARTPATTQNPSPLSSTAAPMTSTSSMPMTSSHAMPMSSTAAAIAPAPIQPAAGNRRPATQQPSNPATQQPTADNRQPIERFPPHPDNPYVELAYDDIAWLHSKGVLFLDARRTSVYEDGHIPGARPFSVWESDVDDKVNKLFAERPDPQQQNLPIVIYCSGGDCEDSHMLAQKLWGIQFNNVYVYKDGFPDWQKHGSPIDKGDNP